MTIKEWLSRSGHSAPVSRQAQINWFVRPARAAGMRSKKAVRGLPQVVVSPCAGLPSVRGKGLVAGQRCASVQSAHGEILQ